MIFVRNNSGLDFADRYDGVDYDFPDGKLIGCPVEAATHIFGYGLEDKTANMIRLGWAANSGGIKQAFERLDKFEFLQGKMMVQEALEEPPVVNPVEEEVVANLPPEPRQEVALQPPANNLLSKMASMAG